MKFISINEWLNEETISERFIVLYPGGFKPMTGGHLDLIEKYAHKDNVKEVLVLIGALERDGINQDTSYEIANILLKSKDKIIVEKVDANNPKMRSPLATAYEYVAHADQGVYTLAASNKGGDYKRVLDFIEQHQKDGKYFEKLPEGVEVKELIINSDPLCYKGRTDEFDGKPISASILRNDLAKLKKAEKFSDEYDNLLNNFCRNYPDVDRDKIDQIIEILS